MKPRPLHRSLTFWSGILVVGFLVWAWVDSTSVTSWVGGKQWSISNTASGLAVDYGSRNHATIGREEQSEDINEVEQYFPEPFFIRGQGLQISDRASALAYINARHSTTDLRSYFEAFLTYQPAHTAALFIPYWLLLLTFALPWSFFLIWRGRRHRRAVPLTNPEA